MLYDTVIAKIKRLCPVPHSSVCLLKAPRPVLLFPIMSEQTLPSYPSVVQIR